jgi:putative transposase
MRKELPTRILFLLLSPLFVFTQQKQSSQPKAVAFTHVTIIDVAVRDSRRALKPNQTVVVTGDRITDVGGTVRIPDGPQVIDASDNGRFREECLNVHWFASLEDAQQKIDAFRWDYNEHHPHRALKGLSPREYARRAMQTAADSPL